MFKKLFRSSKKKSKEENVIETKEEKNLQITKKNGNTVSTSIVTATRQTSSSSHTTESFLYEKRNITTSPILASNNYSHHRGVSFDARPFKAQPPRSVYTSEPLTIRQIPTSPLRRSEGTRSSNTRVNPYNAPYEDFRDKIVIKVQKSEKFYDDRDNSKVPVYRTRSKNKGKLLLVNNIKFTNDSERVGAELDEKNLVALFKGIGGFDITRYQNLNKKNLETNIKKFRDSSLKKYDIATVVIMSHGTGTDKGNNTQIVCCDGLLLETSWVIQQFDNTLCEALIGKPKIFVFQCCRGTKTNVIHHDSTPNVDRRQQSDMLIAYSTIPGFVSHRDPHNGTWYIQAICKIFMEHAHDTDVENLLKMVDSKLSYLDAAGSKQTSSFENRGFKTCYLHPQLYE